MSAFHFTVPTLGNKFIDYRQQILGNSFTWSWQRPLSQVKYLCIHHSAGPDTQGPDDIARYHVHNRGWGGVGYHFIITPNGNCYYVGDLTTARAHVRNYNHSALGICLIGTFMNGCQPTPPQINSAHHLCSRLLFHTPALPGINGWDDIVGHKQLAATACPGETWSQYRSKIIAGPDSSNSNENEGNEGDEGGTSDGKREQQISDLYRTVLGREPDQAGLQHYLQSDLSLEQIRKIMTESPEHSQLMQQARQLKQAQRLAQGSLKHLSQGYWQLDQVQKSLDGDAQQAQDQLTKTLKKVMNNIARAYWSINKI